MEPLNLIPEINVIRAENKNDALIENLYRLNFSGKIVIYCLNKIENVSKKLKNHNLNIKNIKKFKVAEYFGSKTEIEISDKNHNNYFLLHYNHPPDLKLYFRDITDRKYSSVILLYNPEDKYIYEDFIKETEKTDKNKAFELFEKIEQVEDFAVTRQCRVFYLFSSLFFYTGKSQCGICDNCKLKKLEMIDVDFGIIKKILLSIKESREKFGFTTISDILKGYKTQTVKKYNLSGLSGFGSLKTITRKKITEYIKLLQDEEILFKSGSSYGALQLSPNAQKFLDDFFDLKIINLPKHIDKNKEINFGIFCELRLLRSKIARMYDIPAFSVFKDEVLQEMSVKLPDSEDKFLKLKGVGKVKFKKFGSMFINRIKELKNNKD